MQRNRNKWPVMLRNTASVRRHCMHARPISAALTVIGRIARSAQVIPPEFLNSPQYNCEPLSEALGCQCAVHGAVLATQALIETPTANTMADGIAVRVHNSTVYIAGQVANNTTQNTRDQTAKICPSSTNYWPRRAAVNHIF